MKIEKYCITGCYSNDNLNWSYLPYIITTPEDHLSSNWP